LPPPPPSQPRRTAPSIRPAPTGPGAKADRNGQVGAAGISSEF
jgi:hypothetical protein